VTKKQGEPVGMVREKERSVNKNSDAFRNTTTFREKAKLQDGNRKKGEMTWEYKRCRSFGQGRGKFIYDQPKRSEMRRGRSDVKGISQNAEKQKPGDGVFKGRA